jgi:hypothetical protein
LAVYGISLLKHIRKEKSPPPPSALFLYSVINAFLAETTRSISSSFTTEQIIAVVDLTVHVYVVYLIAYILTSITMILIFADFMPSGKLIIGVNSVLALLQRVVLGDVTDVSEVRNILILKISENRSNNVLLAVADRTALSVCGFKT